MFYFWDFERPRTTTSMSDDIIQALTGVNVNSPLHWESGTVATIDMPGVKKDELDISVVDGKLLIATKSATRKYGTLELALHKDTDANAITATLADGVLRLDMPRTPESKPRQIEVK